MQVAAGTQRGANQDISEPEVFFAGGRDRLLVRGVAQRGQAYDRRNFLIHAGEVLGEIASGASIAFSGVDFKNGVSVFRAAFMPGMGRLFPDFTIDQLNRLNDMGFSANTSYKIVVPKSGSVPFVTFVPSEIYYANFKKAGQDDLRNFANHLLVIFAGVHIAPIADSATVQSFTCSPLTGGSLDLSKDGDYTCKLTGTNLGSLAKVRLVSATDSSEPPLEATIGTDGTVTFKVADLRSLKSPEYQVHTVDKNGRNENAKSSIKLRPVVLKDPTAKCDKVVPSCTLTLEGANLARVGMVVTDCGGDKRTGLREGSATGTSNRFRFDYDKLNGKTGCKISFDVDEQTIDSGKTVDFK